MSPRLLGCKNIQGGGIRVVAFVSSAAFLCTFAAMPGGAVENQNDATDRDEEVAALKRFTAPFGLTWGLFRDGIAALPQVQLFTMGHRDGVEVATVPPMAGFPEHAYEATLAISPDGGLILAGHSSDVYFDAATACLC